jgi:hypothetical protein
MRVSMPITKTGLRLLLSDKTAAAARPICMASSQVNPSFATPRTPSVPKSLPIKNYPIPENLNLSRVFLRFSSQFPFHS